MVSDDVNLHPYITEQRTRDIASASCTEKVLAEERLEKAVAALMEQHKSELDAAMMAATVRGRCRFEHIMLLDPVLKALGFFKML